MFDAQNAQEETLLDISNIEVIYNSVILVLRGVSLQVPKGGITALLGGNGAGKTTTLKAISNLLLSRIAEVAAFSVGDSFLSWHGLLSIIRKSEMSRAREDEDWQTLAEQYADENDALELELTTSREALERQSRETNEARQQADHWKNP